MTHQLRKLNRKDFFSNYLRDLCSGLEDAFSDELTSLAEKFPELIRPPGALPEKEFLEQCARCGSCVKSCPFYALAPVLMGNEFDRGTPMLREGQSYCRFCVDFPCISVCQTGALSKKNVTDRPGIGSARVRISACLRSHGKECRACSDMCASLARAITCDLPEAAAVDPAKCTGCGACVTVCPAYPDAAIKLFR